MRDRYCEGLPVWLYFNSWLILIILQKFECLASSTQDHYWEVNTFFVFRFLVTIFFSSLKVKKKNLSFPMLWCVLWWVCVSILLGTWFQLGNHMFSLRSISFRSITPPFVLFCNSYYLSVGPYGLLLYCSYLFPPMFPIVSFVALLDFIF